MDKKRVLIISGLINIIVLIIILINIIIIFPLTYETLWIYGFYIVIAGLITYLTGIFLTDKYYLEFIGTFIVIIGEIFIIIYFAVAQPLWANWISIYFIFPTTTFFTMMIIAYYNGRDDLENKRALNVGLMLVSGSFFSLMVESAIKIPELFQSVNVPIWAIIIIVGGLMLYAFTTWKIFEGGSYIMALTGAFIVNIGVIMLELFYRIHEITGIFTLLFLPPAGIFFLLIFINYKISPYD